MAWRGNYERENEVFFERRFCGALPILAVKICGDIPGGPDLPGCVSGEQARIVPAATGHQPHSASARASAGDTARGTPAGDNSRPTGPCPPNLSRPTVRSRWFEF